MQAATPATALTVTNKTFATRPVVVHAHGVQQNVVGWNKVKDALFGAALPCAEASPVLTLLTCNNGAPSMGLFERSAALHGLSCVVGGHGIDPWINSIHKPRVLAEALAGITTEFTLYADSRDAVLIRDPIAAVDALKAKPGCQMLFGSERLSWPRVERFTDFESSRPEAAGTQFKYLNGGVWVGRTEFARDFFQSAMTVPPVAEAPESEQGVVRHLFMELWPSVQLDYRCELVQNLGYVFTEVLDVRLEGVPQ